MIAEKNFFCQTFETKLNANKICFAYKRCIVYQSFTSLLADFRQDINGGFAFIWYLNETFH